MSVCNDCQRDFLHCRCDLKALQARVKELESAPSPVLDLLGKFKEENARLVATLENSQRHYEYEMAQLRKVVDAARKVVGLVSADNCVALAKALRELDGEKKCDSCGMPDSDPKSVICNDGFHTPKN